MKIYLDFTEYENELFSFIEKAVEKVLNNRENFVPKAVVNHQLPHENIDWFSEQVHKAKSSVYSDLSRGKTPKYLIHKPKGAKHVLFYSEKVLQWIELGCPIDFTNNEKGGCDE